MMRTLLEYFIQRSIDRNSTPPAWLRFLLRRDERFRDFDGEARELDQVLRVSATARREQFARSATPVAHVTPTPLVVRNVPSAKVGARLAWCAATAAALVGVTAFINHSIERQTHAEQVRLVSTQLSSVPNDMLSLLTEAARAPRDYSPLAHLSLPEMNVWREIPRNTQGQLRQSFSEWGSQLTDLGGRVRQRFDFSEEPELN